MGAQTYDSETPTRIVHTIPGCTNIASEAVCADGAKEKANCQSALFVAECKKKCYEVYGGTCGVAQPTPAPPMRHRHLPLPARRHLPLPARLPAFSVLTRARTPTTDIVMRNRVQHITSANQAPIAPIALEPRPHRHLLLLLHLRPRCRPREAARVSTHVSMQMMEAAMMARMPQIMIILSAPLAPIAPIARTYRSKFLVPSFVSKRIECLCQERRNMLRILRQLSAAGQNSPEFATKPETAFYDLRSLFPLELKARMIDHTDWAQGVSLAHLVV